MSNSDGNENIIEWLIKTKHVVLVVNANDIFYSCQEVSSTIQTIGIVVKISCDISFN